MRLDEHSLIVTVRLMCRRSRCLGAQVAYIKAVAEAAPNAQIIVACFHPQRLTHYALDRVRRAEVRQPDTSENQQLKGARYTLQKNPWSPPQAQSD